MASGHAFNTGVDELPISWDHIELRLDAYCATRADCDSLGINVGDFVAFDPLPEFTESGHISARHLDDKAGVAALLAALDVFQQVDAANEGGLARAVLAGDGDDLGVQRDVLDALPVIPVDQF